MIGAVWVVTGGAALDPGMLMPGLEPDPLRALQILPGVQSASDISSGLYIRGGGPDHVADEIAQGHASRCGPVDLRHLEAVKHVTGLMAWKG